MNECGYCKKSMRSEDIKQIVLCNGTCGRAFHIGCTDMNDSTKTRNNFDQRKGAWKCHVCRLPNQVEQKLPNQTNGDTKLMQILTEINGQVSKIDKIEHTLDHYKTKIIENTEKMDAMAKLLNELKEGQRGIIHLKEENKQIKDKLEQLQKKF